MLSEYSFIGQLRKSAMAFRLLLVTLNKLAVAGLAIVTLNCAQAESHISTSQQTRATAHVDFAIVVPTVASLYLNRANDASELNRAFSHQKSARTAGVSAEAAANARGIRLDVAHQSLAERSRHAWSGKVEQRVVYTLAQP